MEYEPPSRGRAWMSRKERRELRKKIIEGGKIADEIRKEAKAHHEQTEIPAAEAEIEEQLREMNGNAKKQDSPVETGFKPVSEKKDSLSPWQRIKNFFVHIFRP